MADFCEGLKALKQTDIILGNSQKFLRFNIRLFICNSPARAYINKEGYVFPRK